MSTTLSLGAQGGSSSPVVTHGCVAHGVGSERRLMPAFVGTVGMALTDARSQGDQVQEFTVAVLAGVSGLLAAFVESVLALVRPGGVTLAGDVG
jgi:hypothetical protein